MQNLSELDLDERALVRKQRPIGWFAAGLLAIVLLGFFIAYHAPLVSAHDLLVKEHGTLAQKAQELDHALVETRKKLDDIEKERGDLKRSADERTNASGALQARLESAGGTAKKQLEKLVTARIVSVDVSETAVDVGFDEKKLFLPGASKVSPQLGKLLCGAVESAAQKGDLALVARTTPEKPGDAEAWTKASEKAASLAGWLEVSCKIPVTAVVAEVSGATSDLTEHKAFVTLRPRASN